MNILNGSRITNKLAPVQIIVLGFAAVILTGTFLLMLPVSSANGEGASFLTALFTSTSAVCVTGLVVVDTGTYWSTLGQVVILLLIQIGGLGFMSFATLMAILLGKKITLRERLVIQEAVNSFSIQGLVKLVNYILIATFSIEAIGASLLAIKFVPLYGWAKGIYYSIFHAVSAYCNAGFDLIGNFRSMVPFQESLVVNFTVIGLIIIGGIGFIVQAEVYQHRSFKKFSLHSKVAVITTGILIVAGFIIFFLLEYNNPNTMGPLSLKGKMLSSLFASVTPRTAGFNTIATDQMTAPSKLITIVMMYIGASPGSTGGGIKTTTFTLLLMSVVAFIKGRCDTEIFERRVPFNIVSRALAILLISGTLIILNLFVLSITEIGAEFLEILFESVSAFGTVGLSLGLTTRLSSIGRVIIILTMFAGRVGPLTLTLAVAQNHHKNCGSIRYPEDKILIG